MTTIIRIEDPETGYGMWQSTDKDGNNKCDSLSNYKEFEVRHSNFPNPFRDKLLEKTGIGRLEFCAFKSVTQLQEWVTKSEIIEFAAMGFKVYMLDVSECVEGEFQIIFKKENIMQTKDITNLFID